MINEQRKRQDDRRRLVERIIRTRNVPNQDTIRDILKRDYGIEVSDLTMRGDVKAVNAVKDQRTGQYVLADMEITRFDLYEMLSHACKMLLHDTSINKAQDTVALYTDLGTSRRFQYLIDAIRQDEQLKKEGRLTSDNIMGCMANSDDTCMVFFRTGVSGKKFYDKIQVLANRSNDYSFAENEEEENFIRKVKDT